MIWNIVIPYKNYVIPAQAGNEVTSGQPNSHSIGTNYRCCEGGCQELGSRLRGSDEEFWAIQAIGESYSGHNPPVTINTIVAPAQAGAYLACRSAQTYVMGTSLRWCDGVFC
jgi:hypothetical protein